MKLGSFGAAVRELDPDGERDTFELFGQEFTVHGVIPPMLMLQLGAAMTGKIGNTEGNAAMWESFRCALSEPGDVDRADETQFERFYRLAVNNRWATDEMIELVYTLIGAQTGKAIEPPPASPDGPPPTSTSSNSSASQTLASLGFTPVDEVLAG